ncbi:MAG: sodium:calcium antiporter, partial [Chloroflexota bacterium]|nr:sodium:calcium antiporter [Chloroflexota bacterium]
RLAQVHLAPIWQSAIFGLAILGAASLLAWAAEAAQTEISQALALAALALVAVLPEYAVDLYFAIMAAKDPQYAHYAVANMTGGNRLLIGVGWALIPFLLWLRRRKAEIHLEKAQTTEISILIVATLYSFTIPLKGNLSLVDTAVLFGLFGLYLVVSYRAKVEEFEPEGPSASICALPRRWRRLTTVALFLYPAALILLSAEPFAEGLIHSGKNLGIDEFLLVQWVAPLASESPEVVAVSIFALRGAGAAALGALVSSKVNQWTLLIGALPLAYSISLGAVGALPMDARQVEELFLTSAQTVFAIALIANRRLSLAGALALFVLFSGQLFLPLPAIRYGFAFFYLLAALFIMMRERSRIREIGGMLHFTAQVLRGQKH